MYQTFLIMLTLLSLGGCYKINNKIDKLEYDCGETDDFKNYRYVKLFNGDGSIEERREIQLRNETGEDLSRHLTSKACIKVDRSWDQKLIVIRPGTGEGLVFFPERIQDNSIVPLNLKTYRYGKLASLCQTELATSSSTIGWPIDFRSIEPEAFEWKLMIQKDKVLQVSIGHSGFEELAKESIDISALTDGSYHMSIQARPLFSKQAQESVFDCQLLIDREAPTVTVDRELIRLDEDKTQAIRAAPGESIPIQTAGSGSVDSIYACLLPQGRPLSSCKYDQIAGGFVTAPHSGTWTLRAYAKDQAGNQGAIQERQLLIYDTNLVGKVQAHVEQSVISQKSGASLFSMIFGIKAYESMKTMGSKIEIEAVRERVRKAVLESTLLPVEELIFKVEQNGFIGGLGLWKAGTETFYLQKNSSDDLELYDLNGKLHHELQLQNAYGIPARNIGTLYCETSNVLLSYGKNKIIFHDKDLSQTIKTLGERLELNPLYGDMSADCRVALLEGREGSASRQVLINMHEKTIEILDVAIKGNLLGYFDREGRKLLVSSGPGNFQIFDRDSAQQIPLSESVQLEIVDVRKILDGSTAILSRDKVLTVLGADGQKSFTKERVDYFAASQNAGEIIVIYDQYYLQILDANDGAVKSRINVSGPNWTYLSATEDFVVGLSAGSNVVKIWTRTGNPLDDIYNKGDSIQRIWVSRQGYLHVASNQFVKLYRLKNSLSQKLVPTYWNAVGLQFSADGGGLIYKERQPEMQDMQNYAVNNLVYWNLTHDQTNTYPLAQAPLSSRPYPGYGSQTRDLQLFTEHGKSHVAAAVKRGNIAIYQADKLDTAIEEYELTSNWLLDIAVDPRGELLAAASQNGLIFLVGRKNGGFGTASLTDIYPQYFEEYPVTLHFDSSGRYLFVTDLNRNLMKFAVAYNEASQSYSLTLESKVSEAGVNLAINAKGDTLAVVGQGAKLKLFDTDLKLIQEYDLSSSSITLGQSVSFSPDGSKVYAGVYDGTWNELDLKTGQLLKVRFSSNETGATNLVVAPEGDRIAFMGGGFVQVADLDVDRVYRNICSWLRPRLPYIPDLSEDDRRLCAKMP
jgi:WD40 repeat protein